MEVLQRSVKQEFMWITCLTCDGAYNYKIILTIWQDVLWLYFKTIVIKTHVLLVSIIHCISRTFQLYFNLSLHPNAHYFAILLCLMPDQYTLVQTILFIKERVLVLTLSHTEKFPHCLPEFGKDQWAPKCSSVMGVLNNL